LERSNREQGEDQSAGNLKRRDRDAEEGEDRSARGREDREDGERRHAGAPGGTAALGRRAGGHGDEDRRGRDRVDHGEKRGEGDQSELDFGRLQHSGFTERFVTESPSSGVPGGAVPPATVPSCRGGRRATRWPEGPQSGRRSDRSETHP